MKEKIMLEETDLLGFDPSQLIPPINNNECTKEEYEEVLKENDGKKFDVVLMNPPYDAGHHLYMYFLNKTIEISNKLISVNPVNFIFSKTNKGIHKKLKNNINNSKLEIEEIDSNKYFNDAKFFNNQNLGICIFSDKENDNNISIKYINNDIKIFNSEKEEITRADLNNNIVKSIIQKINKFDHKIWERFNFLPNYTGFGLRNKIKKFDDDTLFVYLPIKTDSPEYLFFTNKNSKRNEVLTVGDKQTSGGIEVKSKEEGNNIIKYFKTDLVRFCYYLGLNGYNGGWKGFELIPLINFNNNLFNNSLSEINNSIYNLCNLNNKEILYIQNIIKDSYNIRNNE